MKTKQQKANEIEKAESLLKDAKILVFTDFSAVTTEELRKLRRELQTAGAKLMVIKKRLLGVLMKKEGHEFDAGNFEGAVGTVFSKEPVEKVAAPIFKFFKNLKLEKGRILGGYDITDKAKLEASYVTAIGQLPPREVLLGQLVGMLIAPVRSLVFVLDQKAKQQ